MLQDLPNELVLCIASYLPPRDIRALTLTSRGFPSLLSHLIRSAALRPECAKSALWWAVLTNDRILARSILEHGGNIAVARTPNETKGPNPGPRDVTWSQSTAAHCEYARSLSRSKEYVFHASPGACDDQKLEWIMAQGTRLLLKKDVPRSGVNGWFTNPHDYAIEKRHHALLKLALDVGDREPPHEKSGPMPKSLFALAYIVESRDQELARITLDYINITHGPDIHQIALNMALTRLIGRRRGTRAKNHDSPGMLEFLLEKGADANLDMEFSRNVLLNPANKAYYKSGISCLHEAVRYFSPEVVGILLKHGANPNAQCLQGYTPIMQVSKWNPTTAVTCAQLLLDHGADIHIKDKTGTTVLMIAASEGDYAMVEFLLKNGAAADVMACEDKQQRTALHAVVVEYSQFMINWRFNSGEVANTRYETVIKLLLENGADANARDSDGNTALDMLRLKVPQSPTVLQFDAMGELLPVEEKIAKMLKKDGDFRLNTSYLTS